MVERAGEIKDSAVGAYETAKEFAKDPGKIKQVAQNEATKAKDEFTKFKSNPRAYGDKVADSIIATAKEYKDEFVNNPGKATGKLAVDVALTVTGVKLAKWAMRSVEGLGALTKIAKVIDKVEDAGVNAARGANKPKVKEALEFGKKMHKEFDYGPDVIKKQRLPSGKRMDGYNPDIKTI